MSKELVHILEAIGLNDREARLYLVGLKIGSAPAAEYARRTKLNRITTYNTLEALVRKGCFGNVRKARGKWYSPVAPESLSIEAQKNAAALERALPDLRALQGTSYRKPRVRFYEGWEGILKVYADTLTAESEILNFANSVAVRDLWPNYDEEYVAQRVERGIHLRGIAPKDIVGGHIKGKDKKSLREIRLVSKKDFDFENEINIYDHKVAICSFSKRDSDRFGVIIESQEVSKSQRQIFEMAWRYAGR